MYDQETTDWQTAPFDALFDGEAAEEHAELFGIGQDCRLKLLQPGADGVGPYHINTHKLYFQPPAGSTPQQLTRLLYNSFPAIFSPRNLATVILSRCRQGGFPTFKFTFDAPGPDLHDDWVRVEWQGTSFVARTLERLWIEPWEAAARVGAGVLPVIPRTVTTVATVFGRIATDINRRHFLAGRRSWHVGQTADGLFFIETAAFERYSHPAYQAAENVIGIPAQIVEIWSRLLENFVQAAGATTVARAPAGYRSHRSVYWNRAQDTNPVQLRLTGWFRALLARHPGL